MSLIMPWLESRQRTDQFQQARSFLNDHKRWQQFPTCYQGYVKALRQDHKPLVASLWDQFQQQLPELARDAWRWKSYVTLAVDGSRLECPRTPINEEVLGRAGREKTGPQTMLTVLYHFGTALPFAARVGTGVTSEQRLLAAMLDELPERTLLLTDGGFFSADLAHALIDRGHAFLCRVGSDKYLLTELFDEIEFGDNQQVWVWTHEMRSQRQLPLSLRLIELETNDPDQPNVFLLTNLADEELSDAEADRLYACRWGVEIFFRSGKQTLESRKLKSRTPDLALAEADWLVLSLFLLGSLTVREQPASSADRARWSPAKTRRVVCHRMRHSKRSGGKWSKRLKPELRGCVIDRYRRNGPKSRRRHPQKKKEKPPGPPKIRPATKQERRRAEALRNSKQQE